MGFFDSLCEGVKEGGKLILDNAGSIVEAGKIIARVAGFRGLNENEINIMAQSDSVLRVFDDYSNATKVLEAQAESKRKSAEDPGDMTAMVDAVTNTSQLSGAWVNPVAITEANMDQAKNMDFYQDLSKFLTLLGAKPHVVTKGKNLEDLAKLVAQALFANADVQSSSDPRDRLDDHVQTPVFTHWDAHSETCIKAAHAHYKIPMGDNTPQNIWHGAISVSVVRDRANIMRELSMREGSTYEAEVQSIAGGSTWSVGLNVNWADRDGANEGVSDTVKFAPKIDNSYSVIANTATGRTQIIRLVTPAGKTPADARAFMTNVVRESLVHKVANKDISAMPQVLVTTSVVS